MKTLIDGYHQRMIIPVLNRDTHKVFLEDYIPDYVEDGFPSLERFAVSFSYKVIPRDSGFRFAFYPNDGGTASNEWPTEDVPVDTQP